MYTGYDITTNVTVLPLHIGSCAAGTGVSVNVDSFVEGTGTTVDILAG